MELFIDDAANVDAGDEEAELRMACDGNDRPKTIFKESFEDSFKDYCLNILALTKVKIIFKPKTIFYKIYFIEKYNHII